jgi:hypothetical protein
MKKLIILLLSILIFSCTSRSYVSDNEAIVQSVEKNTNDKNPWIYLVKAVYINGEIDLHDISGFEDPRLSTKSFYLYTNKKYTIGDTIRLAQ